MCQLTKSFAVLVAYNNGKFKSVKQATFMLSKLDNLYLDSSFTGEGFYVYRNQVNIVYVCDKVGVTKTVKFTPNNPQGVVTWERQSEEQFIAGKAAKESRKAKIVFNRKLYDQAFELCSLLEKVKDSHISTIMIIDRGDDNAVIAYANKYERICKIRERAETRLRRRGDIWQDS